MASMDMVLARLERLETENARLRQELEGLRAGASPAPPTDEALVSRRHLLVRAGAGAGALALGAVAATGLLDPPRARGLTTDDGEAMVVGGSYATSTGNKLDNPNPGSTVPTLALSSTDGYALDARSSGSNALFVRSNASGPASIMGYKTAQGPAVQGTIARSDSGWPAVYGTTNGRGPGTLGENTANGHGAWGRALGNGAGLFGESAKGRGAVVKGKKAQLRLQPSGAATHPASGAAGDLFVDKSKRLWFCKGGTRWTRLA